MRSAAFNDRNPGQELANLPQGSFEVPFRMPA